jgi:hypothetical protein
VPLEERVQVHRGGLRRQVEERVRFTGLDDADGLPVGEVAHRDVRRGAEPELWQPLDRQRGAEAADEVRPLVALGRQPRDGGLVEDGVQHHQPLHGAPRRQRLAKAAMRLADGGIQASMVDVVQPRPRMQGRVRCGDAPFDQAREELARVVAVSDAGERAVLPDHAHPRVQHHRDQECCLALREALGLQGCDARLEGQRSGARPGRAEAAVG